MENSRDASFALLRTAFRRSLGRQLDAVLAARTALLDGNAGVEVSLQRLSTALGPQARSHRLNELASAADRLARASRKDLAVAADDLLAELRRAIGLRAGPQTVLIVEDEPALRAVLSLTARPYANQVFAVDTAAGAREILRTQAVSLVILDLGLPDGDGRGLLAEITAAHFNNLPVIVLTAHADLVTRTECLALGAREIHAKPPDPVAIATAIGALTGHEERSALMVVGDAETGLFEEVMLAESVLQLADRFAQDGIAWSILAIWPPDETRLDGAFRRKVADVLRSVFTHPSIVLGAVRSTFFVVLPESDATRAAEHANRLAAALRAHLVVGIGGTEGAATTWERVSATARRLARLSAAAGEPVIVAATPEDRTGRSVLVVDDDPVVPRLIEAALRTERIKVHHQLTGLRLLEAVERQRPDLIVLDVELPEIDGLELLRALRSDAIAARVPVVILTAHAAAHIEVAALEAGASDFLSKPFDPAVLLARIRRRLPDRAQK